ncbi:MAG: hypothetical protein K0Q70_2421, partial [Rhodospirillales bacterium]|nr:hypothetical protein [Rhodospirillales bacterium]
MTDQPKLIPENKWLVIGHAVPWLIGI